MIKTSVYNQIGEKVSETDLNPRIFGVEKIDVGLVHQALRSQRNNARKAIAHTKNRGQVSGGGKKPWRQKGTGNARAGSIRSPLWKGGGVTFGPTNARNFSQKMNRSAFRQALFTVLSDKLNDKKAIVIDSFPATDKTKDLARQLRELSQKAGLGKKVMLILDKYNKELDRAAGNLPFAKILVANNLNIFDLLKYDPIVLKEALPVIEKTYLPRRQTGLK
ncbi:MAG: 50S ribosomal protein L4 [Candidatus Doudnabacteria bacterium]|nr:50S ribosomal protein L4 [Candidatus Doudnabacteria bacterium]